MSGTPSTGRTVIFWGILVALPVLLLLVLVQGYYLYGYATFAARYCGSFAALDGEIGWVLAPGSRSCIEGTDPETGQTAYASRVFVNARGARGPSTDAPTPAGGILAIGDSWTFGHGIDWEETFAGQLQRAFGRPTALFASPAYSGAQALLLGRRAAAAVRPEAIVYLELGFWGRAVCTGDTRPTGILKPCYWVGPSGEAELVTPPAGHVHAAAAYGLLPGGMVGAGEKTLAYFQIARPLAKARQALVRLGLVSGFADDFAPVAPEPELDAIKRAHLRNLLALAREAGARLVLLDPDDVYAPYLDEAGPEDRLRHVGAAEWRASVGEPLEALPEDQARVPVDGHFGPGAHRLVAALIDRLLAE